MCWRVQSRAAAGTGRATDLPRKLSVRCQYGPYPGTPSRWQQQFGLLQRNQSSPEFKA